MMVKFIKLVLIDLLQFCTVNPDMTLKEFADELLKSSSGVRSKYQFINKLVGEAKTRSINAQNSAFKRWNKEKDRKRGKLEAIK